MESYGDLVVSPDREGARRYAKVSYPIRYGRFHQVLFRGCRFLVNLRGEVRIIEGSGARWPHPAEWLKRTAGDNWLYYASGGYNDVFDLLGEYYIPCPDYPSNSPFADRPFDRPAVQAARALWPELVRAAARRQHDTGQATAARRLWAAIAAAGPQALARRAVRLERLLKSRVSVLPPDCRHVDYDAVPLVVADGCLYNCCFCRVKSGIELAPRSRREIHEQLVGLRSWYGPDLVNVNSLFLGQHDALAAPAELLLFAVEEAWRVLAFDRSLMEEPRLFCFGSVDSLLAADEALFAALDRLPFRTYLNIGFESTDPAALALLGKPVTAEGVSAAFDRMLAINRACQRLEVTGNFVLGSGLPESHVEALEALLGDRPERAGDKGAVYLSPLQGDSSRRQLLFKTFQQLKRRSRLPLSLYLILRL